MGEKVLHAANRRVDVDGFGGQLLAARKREHLRRETRAALRRLQRIGGKNLQSGLRGLLLIMSRFPITAVRKMIEVVSKTSRQLNDRIHLLRLDQRRFSPFPLLHLRNQAGVRQLELLLGAIRDALFQRRVHTAQLIL